MIFRLSVVAVTISLFLPHKIKAESVMIDFYGENLEFHWQPIRALKRSFAASEKDLRRFYDVISVQYNESIAYSLSNCRKRLTLNDWLYYELIGKVSSAITECNVNRAYLKWYFLATSGYKASIIFETRNAYVAVESTEEVHGFPRSDRGYCLDCPFVAKSYTPARFSPFAKNKIDFSFAFLPLPSFSKEEYVKKIFTLSNLGAPTDKVEVKFSTKLMRCLQTWGNRNLKQTFSTILSPGTSPLVRKFGELLDGSSDSLKVEYLTDFVRQNSVYKPDKLGDANGDRWLTPEEFLFYGSGDCEDRCSFLYYTLKELVANPLVILVYQDHVNLAISVQLKSQCNFYYKDLPYYIIEPTSRVSDPIPLGQYKIPLNAKYRIIE